MRVLHVTKKLPPLPGGDAAAVAGIAAAQRRRGTEVEVLAYRGEGVAEDGHTHLVGPAQSAEQLDRVTLRRVWAVRALKRWAEENLPRLRPDVVHAHAVDVGLPVAQTAHRLNIPAILTCHGVWFSVRGAGSPLGRLERSLIARAPYAAITSVDGASVRALQGAGFTQAVLVPNGVDPAEFGPHAPHEGPFRFLFVGRLVPQKGVDVLLEATALARPRSPQPFAVVLVGDGPLRTRLENQAKTLGISDIALFRGTLPRDDLRFMWRTADAFVLPSRYEGFPIALLEAWAAGAPAIVTSVGGIPEVCSRTEAEIVPPEDPKALAEAMLSLLTYATRRDDLARSARSLVEKRFNWDAVAEAYAAVYARAMGRREAEA